MRRPRRFLRAGRAVFNASAELCSAVHPNDLHNGDSACGLCYDHIVATINNPVNRGREVNGFHRWRLVTEMRKQGLTRIK